ncbi:VNN1-like protein [Mya arenaria]|uniref:VNN1-like protein n=1 Tax=Mya arenaria TaxID=6604 RepID=A0ABY7F978_MYAAR|nr:VNN1-like protein [Mya arenaria]
MQTVTKNKAKNIVFSEYGVLGWTRHKLAPFLEYIPDPAGSPWNPCDNPNGSVSAVQTLLSCIAKNNSIYVVANIGSQQHCVSTDKSCPSDHVYQFNTNVVYDPRGIFIARYFKCNLDSEEMQYFDRPPVVNHTIFDTPFGRFATVCSNDILYKEPTLTLVKTMNITNLAMPAAWKEELPLMSAIEFHSAFAEGLLINVLAANLHVVDLGYYGSGLY